MVCKYLIWLLLLFSLSIGVFAQDEDLRSSVDNKVRKMKMALELTDSQIYAIKPVVKEYISKRSEVLQEVSGQGIIDHISLKSTLKGLREDEYRKLGKILSEEQMKKWINKDIVMAALNPDSSESTADDVTTLSANGANFRF